MKQNIFDYFAKIKDLWKTNLDGTDQRSCMKCLLGNFWTSVQLPSISASITFTSPVFSLKGFQCHGSCTRSCTVWLRSPSAATASSAPSCCSSSCSSLSSSPSHPASGRWTRCWAPPCSCSTLSSWSSAWCWRIASLLAPLPSEPQELSPPQTSCETGSRTVNSHQSYLSWASLWISVETV